MQAFDIIVLLIVGITAIAGFMRGFAQEVLALVAWILALLAIYYFHSTLTLGLSRYVASETGAAVLAFSLLLLVPYATVKFASKWVGQASRTSVLGPIDRLLGFGFGAIKGTIIVVLAFSILVLGYDTVWGPTGRPDWISLSRSYPFVNAASDELVDLIGERHRAASQADRAKNAKPAG
ncbi:CvpA family protein [Novosphingobium sp. Gsoil 351]|uniref:CvpA family protein n=1 Tax=Novosphingobium sp. Gsoil 351 TaxID=2675225 RepID=UPI0012B49DFA|nr:CvpA family protein [Novosphingobium sp. Gsoil 351]QGN53321.1 CvpA family protein [Novosphingobium sp. Gsoil 351]